MISLSRSTSAMNSIWRASRSGAEGAGVGVTRPIETSPTPEANANERRAKKRDHNRNTVAQYSLETSVVATEWRRLQSQHLSQSLFPRLSRNGWIPRQDCL